jgi:hypothetical protein
MGPEIGSDRVQLDAAEEQAVRALAERTHALLQELNLIQQVIDHAQGCWMYEVLPEAVAEGRAHAIWATALQVITRYLAERLAPLHDVERWQRGVLEEVRAHPNAVIAERVN